MPGAGRAPLGENEFAATLLTGRVLAAKYPLR